jgi:DNA-binding PadR family transcriptional regulator
VQKVPKENRTLADPSSPRGRDPSGTIGRNIEPFLLLDLLRAPSYGYDLIRRLSDYGFRRAAEEPGVVYKVLRSLEDAGSIRSTWWTQESGPARRYYEITDSGRDQLGHRVNQLRRFQERVTQLLDEYERLTGERDGISDDSLVADGAAAGNRDGGG